jgi:hypothetical protein
VDLKTTALDRSATYALQQLAIVSLKGLSIVSLFKLFTVCPMIFMHILWVLLGWYPLLFAFDGSIHNKVKNSVGKNAPRASTSEIVRERFRSSKKNSGKHDQAQCEFSDLDIFFVVTRSQYPLLTLMMNSFDVFMPCYNHMHVFVDPNDTDSIQTYLPFEKHNITVRIMDEIGPTSGVNMSFIGGYIAQDWLKIYADYYCQDTGARYVMYLDSDVIFALPLTRSTLFDRKGLPYLAGWDLSATKHFIHGCKVHLGSLCTTRNETNYKSSTIPHKKPLGFMAYYPIVFPLEIMSPLRDYVKKELESNYSKSFSNYDKAFLHWCKHDPQFIGYAQFVVMGNYIQHFHSSLVHIIYTPPIAKYSSSIESANWIPSAVHFWYASRYVSNIYSPSLKGVLPANRYGPKWIALAEELVFRGYCIKQLWQYNITGLGCKHRDLYEIHSIMKLYIGKPFDLSLYKKLYYD